MWVEQVASRWSEGYLYRDDSFKGRGWCFAVFGFCRNRVSDVEEAAKFARQMSTRYSSVTRASTAAGEDSDEDGDDAADAASEDKVQAKICTSRSRKLYNVELDKAKMIDSGQDLGEEKLPEWLRPRRMTQLVQARRASSFFRRASRISTSFRPSKMLQLDPKVMAAFGNNRPSVSSISEGDERPDVEVEEV